jgi:hypothetical protein
LVVEEQQAPTQVYLLDRIQILQQDYLEVILCFQLSHQQVVVLDGVVMLEVEDQVVLVEELLENQIIYLHLTLVDQVILLQQVLHKEMMVEMEVQQEDQLLYQFIQAVAEVVLQQQVILDQVVLQVQVEMVPQHQYQDHLQHTLEEVLQIKEQH